MALNLPRLPIITAIVDLGQRPTPYYQKLWALLCSTLEANDVSNAALLAQLNAQQSALAAQLAQINAVQVVANTAGNTGAGGRQTATNTRVINSGTYTTVATVTFSSAVAASSVSLNATGPTGGSSAGIAPAPTTHNGQVQVLRNGMVIAATNSYSIDASGTLTFTNFTAPGADATTGTVVYDLQARKAPGASANATVSFLLDVTRTP